MLIDRLSSLELVGSELTQVDQGRLDIFFDEYDLDALVERRYVTDRFMSCTESGSLDGWAMEDKVHVRLEDPVKTGDDEKVTELALDNGGDLYFTIWNSTALRMFVPAVFEARHPFVTNDPSDKLGHAGISAVCMHQLTELAERLK